RSEYRTCTVGGWSACSRRNWRRGGILEVRHVDALSFLRNECHSGLDHGPKTLYELSLLCVVVVVLNAHPDQITGDVLAANHLIEKPVAQDSFSHIEGCLLGQTVDLAGFDPEPVDLRPDVPHLLFHLDSGEQRAILSGVREIGDGVWCGAHPLKPPFV